MPASFCARASSDLPLREVPGLPFCSSSANQASAYSDPDFLAAVHARVGVISVGLHNDYGHPSPILLGEMARVGVPVRRTDLDGDVAVTGPYAELATVTRETVSSQALGGRTAAAARTAPAPPDGLPGVLNYVGRRRPPPASAVFGLL